MDGIGVVSRGDGCGDAGIYGLGRQEHAPETTGRCHPNRATTATRARAAGRRRRSARRLGAAGRGVAGHVAWTVGETHGHDLGAVDRQAGTAKAKRRGSGHRTLPVHSQDWHARIGDHDPARRQCTVPLAYGGRQVEGGRS